MWVLKAIQATLRAIKINRGNDVAFPFLYTELDKYII